MPTQGPAGPTGPTGASAPGATGALQTDSAIDATLQVVKDSLGNSSALRISCVDISNFGGGGISSNSAFGDNALVGNTIGAHNTAIGNCALVNNTSSDYNTAIGEDSLKVNTTGTQNTAVGVQALSGNNGSYNTGIGVGALASVTSGNFNVGIGLLGNNLQTGNCNVLIGRCANAGSAVNDGIAIGTSSFSYGNSGIAIGNGAQSCNTGRNIVIGFNVYACGKQEDYAAGVVIGSCSYHNNQYGGVVIGDFATGRGVYGVALGANVYTCNQSIAIGVQAFSPGNTSISIGNVVHSCATSAVSIGYNSCSIHQDSVVLGTNVCSEKTNTTHVQSLIAYGQAASKTNAIGSTGGSVVLDWDNSNIQTLTLDSNITTLTKSNPIDGAVYTLFLTQGGTGGKLVSWGSDVDWPGGTPPTLSTTAGAVDAVSLIYIAGVTGYYGNANLNFS